MTVIIVSYSASNSKLGKVKTIFVINLIILLQEVTDLKRFYKNIFKATCRHVTHDPESISSFEALAKCHEEPVMQGSSKLGSEAYPIYVDAKNTGEELCTL